MNRRLPRPKGTLIARHAYIAAHAAVKRRRGAAKYHACCWCGLTASDWSYTWDCPDEQSSRKLVWSNDPARYRALCRRCHRAYDRAHKLGPAEVTRRREEARTRYSAERIEWERLEREQQAELARQARDKFARP